MESPTTRDSNKHKISTKLTLGRSQTNTKDLGVRASIDAMLSKDYSTMRQGRKQSLEDYECSRSNGIIRTYIHTIYENYRIVDPLASPHNPYAADSVQYSVGKGYATPKKQTFSHSQGDSTAPKTGRIVILGFGATTIEDNSAQAILGQEYICGPVRDSRGMIDHQGRWSMTFKNVQDATDYKAVKSSLHSGDFSEKPAQNLATVESKCLRTGNLWIDVEDVAVPKMEFPSTANKSLCFPKDKREMISLPVKDSYRYCIGCDQAVLEINIQQHEQECHIFRAMSTLNAEELNHELEEKLQRLSNRIDKGRMEVAQLEEMTLCCSRILQCFMKDSRRQPNEDYLGDYSRFMEISRKWSELIENVSRLNWFLRLRKELVAHL